MLFFFTRTANHDYCDLLDKVKLERELYLSGLCQNAPFERYCSSMTTPGHKQCAQQQKLIEMHWEAPGYVRYSPDLARSDFQRFQRSIRWRTF